MRKLLLLPLVFAATGWAADETVDRNGIEWAIVGLNQSARPPLFTSDFDGSAVLVALRSGGSARVVISDKPWGEASIVFTATRFTSNKIRFLPPDVALVDGSAAREGDPEPTPLLFAMKKEGGVWKIASVRVLKPRP